MGALICQYLMVKMIGLEMCEWILTGHIHPFVCMCA